MTSFVFAPLRPDPRDSWTPRGHRSPSLFRAGYGDTMKLLRAEVAAIEVESRFEQVHTIELDVDPSWINRDGSVDRRRQATTPRVALTIESKYGQLRYSCDRFETRYSDQGQDWTANLRAIAKGLEHLRTLDRYGIVDRGQQYTGFIGIGTGMPMGPARRQTPEEAAECLAAILNDLGVYLAGTGPVSAANVAADPTGAYHAAVKRLHPDTSSSPDSATLTRATIARDVLIGVPA